MEVRCYHVYPLRCTLFPTYFRLIATMFDLTVTLMPEIDINTSLIVLLDPENVGVAVEISLLSYVQAEIQDIAHVLPINGSHLAFTSNPDVGEYPNKCSCVVGHRKCGGSPVLFLLTVTLTKTIAFRL